MNKNRYQLLKENPGPCVACAGQGQVFGEDCWICRGSGDDENPTGGNPFEGPWYDKNGNEMTEELWKEQEGKENLLREIEARRTGRTTRLVDESIQIFFKMGVVVVKDHFNLNTEGHYDKEIDKEQSIKVSKIFENRLQVEHPHVRYEKKTKDGIPVFIRVK